MTKAEKIAHLNDQFRKYGIGCGRFMMTRSIADLPAEVREAIIKRVRDFNEFTKDNNPHGERDLINFEYDGMRILAKFDYMDREMKYGSEDPSDPLLTCRILLVMRAEDY